MRFIDNILYLSYSDYVADGNPKNCGVPVGTYKSQQQRGTIKVVKVKGEGNKAFIEYETLPNQYKATVIEVFGNPYEYVGAARVKELLVNHGPDVHYLHSYQFDNGTYLPKGKIEELIKAASYLRLLYMADELKREHGSKQAAVQLGADTLKTFYSNVCRLIKDNGVKLPSNYNRLKDKLKQYASAVESGVPGASVLISKKWGLQNAKKVKNDNMAGYLGFLCGHPNNLQNTQIAEMYNLAARAMGEPEITSQRVHQIRYNGKQLLTTLAGTKGMKDKAGLGRVLMQNKRKRPVYPLSYVTLDGWDVEIPYQARIQYKDRDSGKMYEKQVYDLRQVLVAILDPFNNYILGYAIGPQETSDLITQALQNAQDHIQELTGSYHKFWQLQSDRFALKKLKPTYQRLSAQFQEAYKAQSKVIEPWFNRLNRICQTSTEHWTGVNITSNHKSQPNKEWRQQTAVKHTQPTLEENTALIHWIVQQYREQLQGAWLEAWAELGTEEKMPMTAEEYFMVFGRDTGATNRLRGEGLRVTIGGEYAYFDSSDPALRKHYAHIDWHVKYNPENLDTILIHDTDERVKFLLSKKHVQPMEMRLQTPEDKDQLRQVQSANKDIKQTVLAAHEDNYAKAEQLFYEILKLDPSAAEKMLLLQPTIDGQQKAYLKAAKQHVERKEIIPDNSHDLSDDDLTRDAIMQL